MAMLLTSCMHYYKASNTSLNTIEQYNLTTSLKNYKYFILRAGNAAFHMDNVTVSEDGQSLTCILDSLSEEHSLHLQHGIKGKMRYKKNQPQGVVINEIHMYTATNNAGVVGNTFTLASDKIQKIELLEKDKSRTTKSYILGGIGYTLVGILVLSIIVVATSNWK